MNSNVIEQGLYSLLDSSKRLGDYSIHSLRRHINLGNIKAVYLSGRIFIPVSELERIEQFGMGHPRARRNGKVQAQ